MSKRYIYQYVCFDIRDKAEIDKANQDLVHLAMQGYDVDWSVTALEEGKPTIRLNRLRKEIK